MTTMKQIAEALGTNESRVLARIVGLKLAPVCDRCGGGGEYSFNLMDGSRCYGCGGTGYMKPKPSQLPAILKEAVKARDDGRLAAYLETIRQRTELKRLSAHVIDVWAATRIAQALKQIGHILPNSAMTGLAEMRDANAKMCDAYVRSQKVAQQAMESKKPEDWQHALTVVEDAIREIKALDYDPQTERAA